MSFQTRREFLKSAGFAAASLPAVSFFQGCVKARRRIQETVRTTDKPNILFVLTDDQGYGDLGFHGNTRIKTANLDKFASESVSFDQFYACPVCAPTRASLMTGRYNYRTGAIDTYRGRAMMYPDETTVAEILRDEGYKTAIYGKWHLGDNYPMRTVDQGFEESIVHLGGGLSQFYYPFENKGYFDPVLMHNGKPEQFSGYCMDIYTDRAIDFIRKNRSEPFFVYLATNTPHTPLQISDEYAEPYRDMGLTESTARIYGMITNIDDNFYRLLEEIEHLGLREDTIVLFAGDNGPAESSTQHDRYIGNLRGGKATIYENGIRVPCFIRWPNKLEGGMKINKIAAHIDIMPTLLDACGVDMPSNLEIDGMSLMPLLSQSGGDWPERTLFFQSHRGNEPQMYNNFAVRNQKYKFLQNCRFWGRKDVGPEEYNFELFDIEKDPYEQNNIAEERPEIAAAMKKQYEQWFGEVTGPRSSNPPNIHISAAHENPCYLTMQDWRPAPRWGEWDTGYWPVKVMDEGPYSVKVQFMVKGQSPRRAHLCLGGVHLTKDVKEGAEDFVFDDVVLPACEGRLRAWAEGKSEKIAVKCVILSR